MSLRKTCAAFSSSLVLACAACASTSGGVATGSDGLPRSESKGQVLLAEQCLINKDTAKREMGGTFGAVVLAIADTIIPTITSYFFDLAVKNAKAESLKKSSSTSAKSDGDLRTTFYRTTKSVTERSFGCVVFLRPPRAGVTVSPEFTAAWDNLWPNLDWRKDLSSAFPGVTLKADEYPEAYAEFLVEPVRVNGAAEEKAREIGFRLVPVTLAFGASGARVSGPQKDVTFNVSITGALVNEKGFSSNPIYTASYVFEELPVGTAVKASRAADGGIDFKNMPAVLRGQAGPIVAAPPSAIPMAPPTEKPPEAAEAKPAGGAGAKGPTKPTAKPEGKPAQKPENDAVSFDVPLTATITETETEAGGELTRQILAAIEKNKESILKPIDNRLKEIVKDVLGEDDKKS